MLEVKSEGEDKKKTTEKKLDKAKTVARVQNKFIAGIDDDDDKYNSAQLFALHYKKNIKQRTLSFTIVVQGMKESIATLETSLKEAMMETGTKNDNWITQLEKNNKVLQEDNKVLKETTSSILELLQKMRSKMQ